MSKPLGEFTCCKCSHKFTRQKYDENYDKSRGCPSCGHLWVKWDNYEKLFVSQGK